MQLPGIYLNGFIQLYLKFISIDYEQSYYLKFITAKTVASDHSPGSNIDLTDPEKIVLMDPIDHERCRYPYCIVWTPIPVLTWIFPFLGHMGICMSSGIIRDFAGSYFVSEDLMAFGNPTKYWQLTPQKAVNGQAGWDAAVSEASEIYEKRMHNLFCDNCHSHVATALNIMSYDGCKNWNMVKLALYMIPYSKYVSFGAFLKTWVPFLIIVAFIVGLVAIFKYRIHVFCIGLLNSRLRGGNDGARDGGG